MKMSRAKMGELVQRWTMASSAHVQEDTGEKHVNV